MESLQEILTTIYWMTSLTVDVLAAILMLVILINLWRSRHMLCVAFQMPGPIAWPLFGSTPLFVGKSFLKDNFYKKCKDLYDKYRLNGLIKIYFGSTNLWVFPTNCQLAASFLSINYSKAPVYKLMRGVVGKGMFQDNVHKCISRREVTGYPVNYPLLRQYIQIINQEADILKDKMTPFFSTYTPFDPQHLLTFASANVFLRALSGINQDIQRNEYVWKPYLGAVESSYAIFRMRMVKPWFLFNSLFWLWGFKAVVKKNRKIQKEFFRRTIQNIHKNVFLRSPTRGICSPFLSLADVSEKLMMNEMITFLNCGYITVATTVTLVLNVLAINQRIQADIYNEIVDHFGSYQSRYFGYDDLNGFDLLTRVIQETMRMFPVNPLLARTNPKKQIWGGYTIPEGVTIGVFVYGIHYDPLYWTNPDRFDPDRFLPEEIAKRPPQAYLPFGRVQYDPIATDFNMVQMKIFLITILRKYKIAPGDRSKTMDNIKFELGLTLKLTSFNDILLRPRWFMSPSRRR